MPFIAFGETQEIVGPSLKLRRFEPAHNGSFLKIPELFRHHTTPYNAYLQDRTILVQPPPFVSRFDFSTAFPQEVSNTSLEIFT
jgi:hypothetical protein